MRMYSISGLTHLRRIFKDLLWVYHDKKNFTDGSELNRGIHSATPNGHWKGPIVACVTEGRDMRGDNEPKDVGLEDFVDWFKVKVERAAGEV